MLFSTLVLAQEALLSRQRTEAIVLHCTATLAHQPWDVAGIDQMHKNRGFAGIGYHYLITLDGIVHNGRQKWATGAHVKGFNDSTIGVAYVGGLRSSDAKPTDTRNPAQIEGMIQVIRDLIEFYGPLPIVGHRDYSPDLDGDGTVEPNEYMKECPCFNAGEWAKSVGLPGAVYNRGEYKLL